MSISFWTTLLCIGTSDEYGLRALEANCVHVLGPFWIMEGDTDYLRDEGVVFEEVAGGSVAALGGLSPEELVKVCRDSYGVDLVEYQGEHAS